MLNSGQIAESNAGATRVPQFRPSLSTSAGGRTLRLLSGNSHANQEEDGMEEPSRERRSKVIRPLSIPGPEMQEIVIISELPPIYALLAVRAFRAVLAISATANAQERLLDSPFLAHWEEEVLHYSREIETLWASLAIIASELRRPTRERTEVLAHACLCIAEWSSRTRRTRPGYSSRKRPHSLPPRVHSTPTSLVGGGSAMGCDTMPNNGCATPQGLRPEAGMTRHMRSPRKHFGKFASRIKSEVRVLNRGKLQSLTSTKNRDLLHTGPAPVFDRRRP
jgi:hypothetical protein